MLIRRLINEIIEKEKKTSGSNLKQTLAQSHEK